MNKTRKFYIVLMVFVSLSSYAVSADVLDAYIGKFMAKSGSMDDKLLGLLGDPSGQSKPSSGRTDKKDGSSTKSDTSDNSIKNVVLSDKTTDVSKKKDAPIIEKNSSADLDKTKNLRKRLNDSSIMTLPAKGSSSINSQ